MMQTPYRRARWFIAFSLLGVLVLMGPLACEDKGYRANVHSTGETRFDIQNVPTNTPEERAERATHENVHGSGLKDEDLEDVVNAWPKLSVAERRQVAETARRLAKIPD